MPRPVKHLLLPEGERLLRLQDQQALEDFGNRQQAPVAHLFAVFFEPVFPIRITPAAAFGQETQYARKFAVAGDLAQPQLAYMREGHHHRQTVIGKPEQIVTFELTCEDAAADVFYGRYPVVGIDQLLTKPKRHGLRSSSWSASNSWVLRRPSRTPPQQSGV